MNPPWSVIFLTTLIGMGQGLFLALYAGEVYYFFSVSNGNPVQMSLMGSALVLALLGLGLIASIFHLGRPERAWRAVSQWRTSWLSREVIALLLFLIIVLVWGGIKLTPYGAEGNLFGFLIGLLAAVLAIFLYICTAMIYVAIKCIKEWHTPLTVVNYLLLGLASGLTLAVLLSSHFQSDMVSIYINWAVFFMTLAFMSSVLSLYRNANLHKDAEFNTALGVKTGSIRHISSSKVERSFGAHEFFHRASLNAVFWLKIFFPIAAFLLPMAFISASLIYGDGMLITAVIIQYVGLLAERWLFFAQVKHPQNIYQQP